MSDESEQQHYWHSYIRDMLSFCDRVSIYTAGLEFDEFVADHRTYDATLRNIGLLGVAVSYIPVEVREAHPEFPWGEILGLRNRLAHTYSQIDDKIIWSVIQDGIPNLQVQLRKLLANIEEEHL